MNLNPLKKVCYEPPTGSPVGGHVPSVDTIELDPRADFDELSDNIFRSLNAEINQLQFLKAISFETKNVDQMIKITGKRMDGLESLYNIVQKKLEFMARHKVKMRSEEVIQKVVVFLLKEIKDIAKSFGTAEFFGVLCKELDNRSSQLDDLIDSEIESKFAPKK